MTTLVFPESSEDWSLAFNSGLARGVFNDDPTSPQFWAHHDFQASEFEDGEIVGDWFLAKPYNRFIRIPRKDTGS